MSRRFKEWNLDCKVYIGNLSETASKQDVENILTKYGKLKNLWVARKPPGFAFVEYEDPRDADNAVRSLDGTRVGGSRIRVEKSHGRSKRNPPIRRGYSSRDNERYYPNSRSRDGRDGRDYRNGRNRFSPVRRGRSRSRSRSPQLKRGRYSRSKSKSFSRSRSRGRSISPRRSPPPRSPRSPPRSPASRSSDSPVLEKSPRNGHRRHNDLNRSRSMTPDD